MRAHPPPPPPETAAGVVPVDGKHAASWWKYNWNDLVSRNLKSCNFSEDWHELAHSWSLWRKVIHDHVESFDVLAEKEKMTRRNRERRQVDPEVVLHCTHPARVFVTVNKAGLN